jgi:hypothetical protein
LRICELAMFLNNSQLENVSSIRRTTSHHTQHTTTTQHDTFIKMSEAEAQLLPKHMFYRGGLSFPNDLPVFSEVTTERFKKALDDLLLVCDKSTTSAEYLKKFLDNTLLRISQLPTIEVYTPGRHCLGYYLFEGTLKLLEEGYRAYGFYDQRGEMHYAGTKILGKHGDFHIFKKRNHPFYQFFGDYFFKKGYNLVDKPSLRCVSPYFGIMDSGRNGAVVLITDQHRFPGAGKENDVDDFEKSESRKTTSVFNIFTDFVEGFLEKDGLFLQRGEFDTGENAQKIVKIRSLMMKECVMTFGLDEEDIKDPIAMSVAAYSWRLSHANRFVNFEFLPTLKEEDWYARDVQIKHKHKSSKYQMVKPKCDETILYQNPKVASTNGISNPTKRTKKEGSIEIMKQKLKTDVDSDNWNTVQSLLEEVQNMNTESSPAAKKLKTNILSCVTCNTPAQEIRKDIKSDFKPKHHEEMRILYQTMEAIKLNPNPKFKIRRKYKGQTIQIKNQKKPAVEYNETVERLGRWDGNQSLVCPDCFLRFAATKMNREVEDLV